jgi:hypothetical protein
MTFDTQPDRIIASLASVPAQTHSEQAEPSREKVADGDVTPSDKSRSVKKPTNAFEAFGSFSG